MQRSKAACSLHPPCNAPAVLRWDYLCSCRDRRFLEKPTRHTNGATLRAYELNTVRRCSKSRTPHQDCCPNNRVRIALEARPFAFASKYRPSNRNAMISAAVSK